MTKKTDNFYTLRGESRNSENKEIMLNLNKNSLMFAPMEGITDEYYRNVVAELYPEWDTFTCDFLRVPSPNPYPDKHIRKHLGESVLTNKALFAKSIYQILTSPGAYTKETVQSIEKLGAHWIDLNLGCPSKTVCKHQGGSFLLSELGLLETILHTIRESFSGTFTCKIRVGYKDDTNFENILKLIEDAGVDAVIIHARTRDELYKGVAKWDYIKKAVELVNIPVIGNGDIWTTDDIERYFDYTNCHSIMLARSALKTPWLARLYKSGQKDSQELRMSEIQRYFKRFYLETQKQDLVETSRIKRLKSVSRFIFDDLDNAAEIKKKFLLSKSFEQQELVFREYFN